MLQQPVIKSTSSQTSQKDQMSKDIRRLKNAYFPACAGEYWISTWLRKAIYYAEHYDKLKDVIETFDEADSQAISKAKAALHDSTVIQNLAYVKSNMSAIPDLITSLESEGALLTECVGKVERFIEESETSGGAIGERLRKKLQAVLKRNPGWKTVQEVAKILNGEKPLLTAAASSRSTGAEELQLFHHVDSSSSLGLPQFVKSPFESSLRLIQDADISNESSDETKDAVELRKISRIPPGQNHHWQPTRIALEANEVRMARLLKCSSTFSATYQTFLHF
ncbi:hypothetical protein GE061_012975 [Apolygus lucorum]|uniref:Uncharacterized protein n=1 Tax=Apolygus lucorum TaxID=248454 RepID=A0A8S9XTV3_APOLU|nr:hypothetical protein GE061_012975 [Apolygus lucorum]